VTDLIWTLGRRSRLLSHRSIALRRGVATLFFGAILAAPALAADKPPLSPDQPMPLVTSSRVSATIAFGLPVLAAHIERDIPRRLATFDERIGCVHRRVLFFKVNANCDIKGYVERTGPVSLYGRGDRVIGAVPIFGTVFGQGANRITSHIHGEAEARANVEFEARPELRHDWSLELNFSDSLHWTEPPYLHVLGHDIALARYAEPPIHTQLARVRARALAAARTLDLHGKAAAAWQRAFKPIKLADDPQVWLQMTPVGAAFAGVHANKTMLEGALELTGTAETFVDQAPPAVTPTPLAPLGKEVAAPGTFDIILPVHINYATLRQKILGAVAAAPKGETTIRDVEIYPSAGKIVVGLRIAKSSDSDANAGEWLYLSAVPQVDADAQTLSLPDLTVAGVAVSDIAHLPGGDALLASLRQQIDASYRAAYRQLLDSANARLTRPLSDGFRLEGHLNSAKVEKILLLAEGLNVALRASGELKILYGL
jgi:Domain of unknown function (DUF4403)